MARQAVAPLTQAVVLAVASLMMPANPAWALNTEGLPAWQGQVLQQQDERREQPQAGDDNASDRQTTPNGGSPLPGGLDGLKHEPASKLDAGQGASQAQDGGPKWTDVVQAISAAAVAGLTIALMVFGRGQLKATKDAADAAKESADISRNALVSTQRAFVFAECKIEIDFDHIKDVNYFDVQPIWINAGTTPALNFREWSNILIVEQDIGEAEELVSAKYPPKHAFIVGPNMKAYLDVIIFSASEAHEIAQGAKYGYVLGQAEYEDIFMEGNIRRVKFCVQVIPFDMASTKRFYLKTIGPFNGEDIIAPEQSLTRARFRAQAWSSSAKV